MKKKYFQITNKSLADLKVKSLKELWTLVQSKGYEGLSLVFDTEFKKAEDSENKFHAVFSTAKEDRHGDIVVQNFEVANFKKNPVFIDSHNYDGIEHIIGKVQNINSKSGKLEGDIIFAREENPKGELAFKMASGGFLGATSIGFIPLEFDKDFKILKSELLEISAVSVPANAQSLFTKKYDESKDNDEAGDGPDISNTEGQNGYGAPDGGDIDKDKQKKNKNKGGEPRDPQPVPAHRKTKTKKTKIKTKSSNDILKLINKAANAISENTVETRSESVTVERNRLINKAVRKLLKLKR